MFPCRPCIGLLIIWCCRCLAASHDDQRNKTGVDSSSSSWNGWTCDDLTPNLCDNLEVSTGTISTSLGWNVSYWRYAPSQLDDALFPIVVVNGGPGNPHNYVLPLRQLACQGRAVIFYNQCGTGSGETMDYPTCCLDINYLAKQELVAVIEFTVPPEQHYHLVAESFGTQVLLQFALNVQPNKPARSHVASFTLNGPIPSTREYTEEQWDPETGTIGTMPAYFQKRYLELGERGAFDDPEFAAMEAVLLTDFVVRNGIMPFPDALRCGYVCSQKSRYLYENARAGGVSKRNGISGGIRSMASIGGTGEDATHFVDEWRI